MNIIIVSVLRKNIKITGNKDYYSNEKTKHTVSTHSAETQGQANMPLCSSIEKQNNTSYIYNVQIALPCITV